MIFLWRESFVAALDKHHIHVSPALSELDEGLVLDITVPSTSRLHTGKLNYVCGRDVWLIAFQHLPR